MAYFSINWFLGEQNIKNIFVFRDLTINNDLDTPNLVGIINQWPTFKVIGSNTDF